METQSNNLRKFDFMVVVKNQKDFLAKRSIFEREQYNLGEGWNCPRKLETRTFLINFGCDPVTKVQKTVYIDKSFLPFIIVMVSVLIAIAIVWLNFDMSFGGTYK